MQNSRGAGAEFFSRKVPLQAFNDSLLCKVREIKTIKTTPE
jgi:hypothetical protein